MYNLAEDPCELRNLAGAPDQEERVRELMALVWGYINRSNDRALMGTHYLPMRFAAVGPNAGC